MLCVRRSCELRASLLFSALCAQRTLVAAIGVVAQFPIGDLSHLSSIKERLMCFERQIRFSCVTSITRTT